MRSDVSNRSICSLNSAVVRGTRYIGLGCPSNREYVDATQSTALRSTGWAVTSPTRWPSSQTARESRKDAT